MKLWAISDLHVGHPKNREALAELPSFGADWLIVAGDVGETEAHLDATFSLLSRRFGQLVWVPGNHELWTVPGRDGDARGEAKYQRLVDLCRRHGVLTPEDPYADIPGECGPQVIAPQFLLYDYSFRPDDVPAYRDLARAEDAGHVCTDEHLLHPDPHRSVIEWCAARVALTEQRLDEIDPAAKIVLVCHFPPRRAPRPVQAHPQLFDLVWHKEEIRLAPPLDRQHRRLRPHPPPPHRLRGRRPLRGGLPRLPPRLAPGGARLRLPAADPPGPRGAVEGAAPARVAQAALPEARRMSGLA